MPIIRNTQDLLTYLESESVEQAQRHLYNHTDCGVWIEFAKHGIKVGSIVEGAEFGTCIYELCHPFATQIFDLAIEAIEAEAQAIWEWANVAIEGDKTAMDCGLDAPDVWQDYTDLEPYRCGRSA